MISAREPLLRDSGDDVLLQARVSRAKACGGSLVKLFAELWRGYADEEACSLGEVFAAEINSAILGDDIIGLKASGYDAGAGSEDGFDFVETLVGGGGHGEERYAALAARGAIDEVVLSAYA